VAQQSEIANVTPGKVTVARNLVPYLRGGVRRELSETFAILVFQVDEVLDQDTYYKALARFDDARALFDLVGVTDEPGQVDLELDLARWPRLVVRALEWELMRLRERADEGFESSLQDTPALGNLLSDVRRQVPTQSKRSGSEAPRGLVRRKRRSRGDG
jgi:hypothetical protein